MLKTFFTAAASLLVIASPVLASHNYVDLTNTCPGRVIDTDICVDNNDGNELRYLAIREQGGLVLVTITGIGQNVLLSVKIEEDDSFHYAMMNESGDVVEESTPGTYRLFQRYFSDEFLYIFSTYN